MCLSLICTVLKHQHIGGSQSKNLVEGCMQKKDEILKVLGGGKGLLYFNPGGNWGDLYRHVQTSRFDVWKLAHENGIKFISGPQSLYYNPGMLRGAAITPSTIDEIF